MGEVEVNCPKWLTRQGGLRESAAATSNHIRFPGQYHDRETDLHYNWHRYYDPRTGRFLQPDPIGPAAGMNLYGYAGGNPVLLIDRHGLYNTRESLVDLGNFWIGVGDVASLGLTSWVRYQQWYGGDSFTDRCSGAYELGKWMGVIACTIIGGGGGARVSLSRKALYDRFGSTRSGLEFSHWIPARFYTGLRLGRFDRRSIWQGNYVSRYIHTMSDPIRHAIKGVTMKDKWHPLIRLLVRIPYPVRGVLLGWSYGTAGRWLND